MKILEIDKKYCKKYYNNDYKTCIEELDGVLYDDNIIKRTFNFGNGTVEDLKRYIECNRKYCRYYNLETQKFI